MHFLMVSFFSGEESESLARAISEADKDRMIASAKAYKPVNPYFKVTVYESYLYGGSIVSFSTHLSWFLDQNYVTFLLGH